MVDIIKPIFTRIDSSANWKTLNPVPKNGEQCIEELGGGLFKLKIGDGITPWIALKYWTSGQGGGSGGNVDDVLVDGVSVVNENKIANIDLSGKIDHFEVLPEITEENDKLIVQYIGETTEEYVQGYFYKSTKISVTENFEIREFENLDCLDWDNIPYTLDVETYKNYIISQGRRLTDFETQFRYGLVGEDRYGWYDSWNDVVTPEGYHTEVDLENNYGVSLHYSSSDHPIKRRIATLSWHSTYRPNMSIIGDSPDSFENFLQRNGFSIPTEPATFYFQCYDSGGKWRVNGIDVGSINLNNIGIYYDEIRAPSFIDGDYITVYYTPAISESEEKAEYLLSSGKFGNVYPNTHGGYVGDLNINTFESMIGTLPTEVTFYRWDCTSDGDARTATWTLDGISANPADYGITLEGVLSRAPQAPFISGDYFVIMYRPNHKDLFLVSYEYWQNQGAGAAVTNLDVDTFKRNVYSRQSIGYGLDTTLICIDDAGGDATRTKWKWNETLEEYNFSELETYFGVTLNVPRAPLTYNIGDFFVLEFSPQATIEQLEPMVDQSAFIFEYNPAEEYYEWKQIDVQPSGGTGSIQTDSSLSGSGSEEDPLQVSEGWLDNRIIVKAPVIPTASIDLIGQIYMYIGDDIPHRYTHGYIYECQGSAGGLEIINLDPSGVTLDETTFINYIRTIARDINTIRGVVCAPVGNDWKISVDVDGGTQGIGVQNSTYVQSMGFGNFSVGDTIILKCAYTEPSAEWIRIDVQPNIQRDVLDNTSNYNGEIVQYIGNTTDNYTQGYFYKSVDGYEYAGETDRTYSGTNYMYLSVDNLKLTSFLDLYGYTYTDTNIILLSITSDPVNPYTVSSLNGDVNTSFTSIEELRAWTGINWGGTNYVTSTDPNAIRSTSNTSTEFKVTPSYLWEHVAVAGPDIIRDYTSTDIRVILGNENNNKIFDLGDLDSLTVEGDLGTSEDFCCQINFGSTNIVPTSFITAGGIGIQMTGDDIDFTTHDFVPVTGRAYTIFFYYARNTFRGIVQGV